jgi:hypothetical protein
MKKLRPKSLLRVIRIDDDGVFFKRGSSIRQEQVLKKLRDCFVSAPNILISERFIKLT